MQINFTKLTILILLPLSVSCQAMELSNVVPPNRSEIFTTTETVEFSELGTSAWTSDTFSGSHSRRIEQDVLIFEIQQNDPQGGVDIGLHRTDFAPRLVDDIPRATSICSSYDISLTGDGRWWAGPKISVNWQGDESAKQNGDDWYENYIVEIASSTPDALHDIFTGDYFKAEILPETQIAGAVYKHYKIRFHDWWQFWSVRQDYRKTGTVPVGEILDIWKAYGLPSNRRFDGVKGNIETYGDMRGTGKMKIAMTTKPDKQLDCKIPY